MKNFVKSNSGGFPSNNSFAGDENSEKDRQTQQQNSNNVNPNKEIPDNSPQREDQQPKG